ncbi:MAG TPA: DUF2079 domain-containing protein [Streptosporangiaceae bacterium]|nr:DUF2079 domain-containing protein [Streptosporangiaceae bacterium]
MRFVVRRHRLWVGVLTFAAAFVYVLYGITALRTFRIGTYDLVIFDQAVRSYSHFRDGISPAKGVQDGFGPDFSVLGDHWSPIIAVLAPLYWVAGQPVTLEVAQGVLFALAIPPLWLFALRLAGLGDLGDLGGAAAAYLACAAYALSWPIAEATKVGFHEVAFVPVTTAVIFERLLAGRTRTAMLAAGVLLLVKEDTGLLVAGLGLVLLLYGRITPVPPRTRRLLGLCLITGGIAATWVATFVLRPAFGGRASYYWSYWALGPDPAQAAWHALSNPLFALRLLGTPSVKLSTMAWLAGALLFLPLLSPVTLAVLPLLLERMLASSQSNWWVTGFQYNAFLIVVLVCAALDGALRVGRLARLGTVRRWYTAACGALCLAAVALVPAFAFGAMLRPSFYVRDAGMRAQAAAVSLVPSGVNVDVADMLGPALSGRDTVLLWGPSAHSASWVVGQTWYTFPWPGKAEQLASIAALRKTGWQLVFAQDGYLVLHRA